MQSANSWVEIKEIVDARMKGKTIEYCLRYTKPSRWRRMREDTTFNFISYRYRVKPEPMVRYMVKIHEFSPWITFSSLDKVPDGCEVKKLVEEI